MERVIDSFRITKLVLENIRGFRRLELDLRSLDGKVRPRTLIIGKNGTGKSTILRAIALALVDETDASRLISEPLAGFLARPRTSGNIQAELTEPGTESGAICVRKRIQRLRDKESISTQQPKTAGLSKPLAFVCGYGAGRFGAGPESGRSYRPADSVATLFRYDQTLIDPELTLRRLESLGSVAYSRTIRGIKRALGLSEHDDISLRPGGGVIISGATMTENLALEGWADGYRLTFSWILDLYGWALRAGSLDEDGYVEGILLIDEIEQHLHPSMQAEILPRLSELLPKMQIFATTHSPLVALDATPDELVVLRREGNAIVADDDVPNFLGYSVEDMLSDPRLFDSEVYGQEKRKMLTEYRELAAIPKNQRGTEQRERLRSLATEIRSHEGYQEHENETSRLLKEFMAKYDL
jgi:energy-coupling factor transporter ATP-binding protein EcfA2